ncbi:DUF418 domain-containing protein [Lutibacter flavus]|uniref:DUF418 domain-containing protein n=1 Tax=Lutibacter flavus TaxID=691689 RepID=A0A238VD27_9FLAO|nr:DUF418 domain-containing protein [Lutibacter flavus]SNR32310.1 uncharacterized protein SAMN04488111_0314 [Lutibacter flavus]
MASTSSRLHVIDALRGFAIVSIMLLHNVEHFDFYFTPENIPGWMASIDTIIWDSLFFIFGGKSYAIFAFLFGLTFFIQFNNQEKRGNDFRPRFAWRLLLLFGFGLINSAFFQGDILTIYAIIGFFLIPMAKLSTKTVFWIALFLMLQPYEWFHFFTALQNPVLQIADPESWTYFGKMGEYIPENNILNTFIGNLTNGKIGVLLWNWENGRIFQILSLFLFGMLAGRKSLFVTSEKSKQFWAKTLIIAAIIFIPFYLIKNSLANWIQSENVLRPLLTIETSWTNIAFMLVLISGFTLLFQKKFFHKVLNLFSPLGKMSLSNYIIQSVVGSSIYYGFGLGLYKYTSPTYGLLIGIVLSLLMGYFCHWWMKNHKHGPLEAIWHKLTWIGTK